jgi:hypothetical protein
LQAENEIAVFIGPEITRKEDEARYYGKSFTDEMKDKIWSEAKNVVIQRMEEDYAKKLCNDYKKIIDRYNRYHNP